MLFPDFIGPWQWSRVEQCVSRPGVPTRTATGTPRSEASASAPEPAVARSCWTTSTKSPLLRVSSPKPSGLMPMADRLHESAARSKASMSSLRVKVASRISQACPAGMSDAIASETLASGEVSRIVSLPSSDSSKNGPPKVGRASTTGRTFWCLPRQAASRYVIGAPESAAPRGHGTPAGLGLSLNRRVNPMSTARHNHPNPLACPDLSQATGRRSIRGRHQAGSFASAETRRQPVDGRRPGRTASCKWQTTIEFGPRCMLVTYAPAARS